MKDSGLSQSKKKSGAAKQKEKHDFPIVAVGASAGGVQALKAFFENVPERSGAAYVVILHLSPTHESHLTEILQTVTSVPVTRVAEKIRVEPDNVYVVSPNESLSMLDGHIVVSPVNTFEERRAPIDIFFRTLAETHHEGAIAVILSGTGSDGSMGLQRIKENGGAVFVQDPKEAQFSEMPDNSIATNLVDDILNTAEIPGKIVSYIEKAGKFTFPAVPKSTVEKHEQALHDIFTLLRLRTGHDFTNYKRSTVLRRIERRINIRNMPDLAAYTEYLRTNTEETQALLKNLLISVTNFFRDKAAFQFFEHEVLPKILEGKKSGDQIRIWVAACATGEEAYSIGMLFAEKTTAVLDAPGLQIFATDIDEDAIVVARNGFYKDNEIADVSPERLARFFAKEKTGYRVRRELREKMLFANHNILKDPPFSRLDLVTCRNLLIYLNPAAQERALGTFHFGLKPGGHLFLGTSESVDGRTDLFSSVNRDKRFYQSRNVTPRVVPAIADLAPSLRYDQVSRAQIDGRPPVRQIPAPTESYGDLHVRILEHFTPPSIIIDEEYNVLHLSKNAGRYLQVAGGELSKNLFNLILPDLKLPINTAVYQAVQRQTNVDAPALRFAVNDRTESVNVSVRPVVDQNGDGTHGFVLIIFDRTDGLDGESEAMITRSEPIARQLEEELLKSQTQFRAAIEQSEVHSEELKAANEELQAMNEELRSATEELETGKEELQSVNEELITVNQELKVKIDQLSMTNSDFVNLITSTHIATVFLDREVRIKMFTPAAREIFNLIPEDKGRLLADITNNLDDDGPIAEIETVLEKLQPIEREVMTENGNIYLMQITPYRTPENRIDGTVLAFIDITKIRRQEDTLRDSQQMYAALVSASAQIVWTTNAEGAIVENSPTWCEFTGQTPEEFRGYGWLDVIHPSDRERTRAEWKDAVAKKAPVEIEYRVQNQDGEMRATTVRALPLFDTAGEVSKWVGMNTDITERREAENQLRKSERRYRGLFDSIDEGFCVIEMIYDDGKPVDYRYLETNAAFETQTGMTGIVGKTVREMLPEIEPGWAETFGQVAKTLEPARFESYAAPLNSWFDCYAFPTDSPTKNRVAVLFKDVTERKLREINLAFMADFNQEMLQLSDTRDIVRIAGAKINRFKGAAVCALFEINKTKDECVCDYEWRKSDAHSMIGKYDLQDFVTDEFQDTMQGGQPVVVRDIDNDSRVRDKRNFDALGIGAFINVPFLRDGEWQFAFGVYQAEPRDWSDDEIALIVRAANSVWSRIERVRATEAVRDAEHRVRILLESVRDYAIVTLDTDGVINGWNRGAEQIFGYTQSEVTGKSQNILFTPEDVKNGIPDEGMRLAAENGRSEDELLLVRKDGSKLFVSGVMHPLSDKKVGGFVKVIRDMTEKLLAEQILTDKKMLQQLVGGQEDERRRIARDLHDDLGQILTALRLHLEAARKLCGDDEELCDKIEETQDLARRLDNGIDFLAWELRPAALNDFGLFAALGEYMREWSHYSGVKAELLDSSIKDRRISYEAESNLYRIAQEALNNANKHAEARKVEVIFDKRGESIVLIVADDGKGFKPKTKLSRSAGVGLIGMRERAALIGGSLEIESKPGEGTTIFVRVPASFADKKQGGGIK